MREIKFRSIIPSVENPKEFYTVYYSLCSEIKDTPEHIKYMLKKWLSEGNNPDQYVNDKIRPRNNSKVCSGENCKSITASKYGLCRFHYKQRWQKLSNLSKSKIIGSIHEHQHPELLGIKNV